MMLLAKLIDAPNFRRKSAPRIPSVLRRKPEFNIWNLYEILKPPILMSVSSVPRVRIFSPSVTPDTRIFSELLIISSLYNFVGFKIEICAPVSIEKIIGLFEFQIESEIVISLFSKINLCGIKMCVVSGLFSVLQSKMLPESHSASIRFLEHHFPLYPMLPVESLNPFLHRRIAHFFDWNFY